MPDRDSVAPRFACDAMCGGLARWLRLLGHDASYTPHIDDAALVEHALAEGRIALSSDRRLFERRAFATGRLRGLLLPVGLELDEQVVFVFRALNLALGEPRCTSCNGPLERVARADVADRVPARSLTWTDEFHRCTRCGQVFWRGTHWRRIEALKARLAQGAKRKG
jgi:hypothetical protein